MANENAAPAETPENTLLSSEPMEIGEVIYWTDEYNLKITHALPCVDGGLEYRYIVERLPKKAASTFEEFQAQNPGQNWFDKESWEAKQKLMSGTPFQKEQNGN